MTTRLDAGLSIIRSRFALCGHAWIARITRCTEAAYTSLVTIISSRAESLIRFWWRPQGHAITGSVHRNNLMERTGSMPVRRRYCFYIVESRPAPAVRFALQKRNLFRVYRAAKCAFPCVPARRSRIVEAISSFHRRCSITKRRGVDLAISEIRRLFDRLALCAFARYRGLVQGGGRLLYG